MSDTTKTIALLLARRAAAWLAAALIAHGMAVAGDPNLSGFTEIVTGALVGGVELCLEAWRKYGMVMISAQVAKIKGIPLPKDSRVVAPIVIPTPDGPNVAVEIKSSAA